MRPLNQFNNETVRSGSKLVQTDSISLATMIDVIIEFMTFITIIYLFVGVVILSHSRKSAIAGGYSI